MIAVRCNTSHLCSILFSVLKTAKHHHVMFQKQQFRWFAGFFFLALCLLMWLERFQTSGFGDQSRPKSDVSWPLQCHGNIYFTIYVLYTVRRQQTTWINMIQKIPNHGFLKRAYLMLWKTSKRSKTGYVKEKNVYETFCKSSINLDFIVTIELTCVLLTHSRLIFVCQEKVLLHKKCRSFAKSERYVMVMVH
jgi:hypothetical protein